MPAIEELFGRVPDRLLLALAILLVGLVLGYLVDRINRRVLIRAGVPEAVEGTAFERTVRGFGTSTVSILARLSMWFIIGVAVLAALTVVDVRFTERFWSQVTGFLPRIFVALFVLIVGIVVGDKAELVVGERLRGVKLPQIGILPTLAKYTVVYIAVLVSLNQIGVATNALLVLLAAYIFALVFLGGVAFKDLLASGAAGMYLLLSQPYSIGDEVRIADQSGIVQEVDLFVTHVESDSEEYIIPNRHVFEYGVVRIRQ